MLPDYTAAVGLVPILPSIASFFFRQFVHKKGPSHGFEEGEKKGPELTDKPSPGGWSTWQIAHLYIPESEFRGKSLPNLHSIEKKNKIKNDSKEKKRWFEMTVWKF